MSENFLEKKLFEDTHCGIYYLENKKIKYWNETAEKITGFKASEVIGRSCCDDIIMTMDSEGNCLCFKNCLVDKVCEEKKSREADVFFRHKDGSRFPVSVRISPLLNDNEDVVGSLVIFSDYSNYKTSKLRILELGQFNYLDSLTQLANKEFMSNEIKRKLQEMTISKVGFGILFIYFNNAKDIFNKHGSAILDNALKMVSSSIQKASRTFDLYGRWDKYQFIGIHQNVGKVHLNLIAERIKFVIENSYMVLADNIKVSLKVCIGGTVVDKDDSYDSIVERTWNILESIKKSNIEDIKIM